MIDTENLRTLFRGLRTLSDSSFPKECKNCGHRYESARQYFNETKDISETVTGLKQSYDDDGSVIVEVFRNCVCGSTLMDFFGDRRDTSEQGIQRREKFSELHEMLIEKGIDRKTAKEELLKFMHGQESTLLQTLGIPIDL